MSALQVYATKLHIKEKLTLHRARGVVFFLLAAIGVGMAQESPYIVTYDHHLEEPGNLEIETYATLGVPRAAQNFYVAPWLELEYGVTASWTSELYLEGQGTAGDSAVFTGWRLENRFRPLKREHGINPVLYLEYENISEASRIQKEIVGGAPDVTSPNSTLQPIKDHEIEAKLILSSTVHDWNLAGNFITEKNLSRNEGFEFGYAFGFDHPLSSFAAAASCRFCRENFIAGVEFYGGLGSTENGVGVRESAHYVAPVVSWQVSENSSIHFSPSFALNGLGSPMLIRFGYSYEIRGLSGKLAQLARGKHP
jgi:hypothetical protein